jgi:LysR family hydrogen peroxide-inducible transcriptional activator
MLAMTLAGLSLRDLEYLLAVAEHLSFGRAAQACAVSQPTLSAQIRKIEELLRVECFERAPRGVLVTPRGAELVAQARLVVAEARRMFEIAAAGAAPLEGTFRLGVISTLGPYLVPFLLKPLRARFPRLRLLLSEGLTRQLSRQVEEGELDAILAASPLPGPELTELKLFREEFVLVVPRDHPLARVEQVVREDIPVPELILLSEGHCLRDHALAYCPTRLQEDRPELQAASLETLRQMVAAGVGVSFMPQLAVQVGALLDDMVAYRRIGDGTMARDVALFHRPGFSRIRDVRLLRQAIREILAEQSAVKVAATLA